MNYFERLVRRALLRPASATGVALEDPFAAVAEWTLETPTGAPAPGAAALAATQRVIDPVREAALPVAQSPAAPSAPAEQAPAAILQPSAAAPTAASERIAQSTVESVQAPPPGHESPPAVPLAPQRDALALADAFMRSIGVQSQLPELAPEPAPRAEAAKPSPAIAHEEKPATVSWSAQVVPPPAPPAAVAARPAARAIAKSATPSPQPRRERPAEAPARTRTVIETRHVLVERKTATSGEDGGVSGGGAPRFGLGQL